MKHPTHFHGGSGLKHPLSFHGGSEFSKLSILNRGSKNPARSKKIKTERRLKDQAELNLEVQYGYLKKSISHGQRCRIQHLFET